MRSIMRVFSIILSLVLVVGLLPVTSSLNAVAVEVPNLFQTGYGSNGKFLAPIDPPVAGSIPISNRAELEAIADNLSGNYHLTADIDLSDAEWVPIGDGDNPFTGVFDGQGYEIRGLRITGQGYDFNGLFGFIGYTCATIMNVGMEKTSISINSSALSVYAGAICGYIASDYYSPNAIISNCYNTGSISVHASSFSYYPHCVGGICGFSEYTTVYNCYNTGTISCSASVMTYSFSMFSPSVIAGGICGKGETSASFYLCYNTGFISTACNSICYDVYTNAGGVAGVVGANGGFDSCLNTGTVSALSTSSCDAYAHAGGIAAYGNSGGNCCNTGSVFSSAATTNSNACVSYGYAGGIFASGNQYADLYYLCNVGEVFASTIAGGIKARSFWSVNYSYCLNRYDSEYGTQLTASQMKEASNFVGFDFENVWDINPGINDGYPFLRNLTFETPDDPSFIPERIENISFTANTGKDGLADKATDVTFKDIGIDYDDAYFKGNSYTYNHELSRMSLALAMSAFNSAEAGNNNDYSADTAGNNVGHLLSNTHFDNIDILAYEGCPQSDSIAVAFGSKASWDGSTLIAVAVRGGAYEREWIGNFEISGKHSFHDGFQKAANQVYDKLCSYINKHKISGRLKIWITGYSRGAATVNLVAAQLDDGDLQRHTREDIILHNSDIYAYTFETPQNTKNIQAHNAKYLNIHNIINPIDVVTKLAMSGWGYTRYGSDVVLPSANTTATYKDRIKEALDLYNSFVALRNGKETMTWLPTLSTQAERLDQLMFGLCLLGYGSEKSHISQMILSAVRANIANKIGTGYDSIYLDAALMIADASALGIVLGESVITFNPAWIDVLWASDWLIANGFDKITNAHTPELCLAWLLSLEENNLNTMTGYRRVFVACPVNVIVYDSQGLPVAKAEDDVFYSLNDSCIGGFVYENEQGEMVKVFILPPDEEYTVKILATEDGLMSSLGDGAFDCFKPTYSK